MFGIGAPEMALIIIVALIFIGPAKLPEVARTIGRTYRELKTSMDGLREEVMKTANEASDDLRKAAEVDEIRKIKKEIMEINQTGTIFRPPTTNPSPDAKPEAKKDDPSPPALH